MSSIKLSWVPPLAGTRKKCIKKPKISPPDVISELNKHKNAFVVDALHDWGTLQQHSLRTPS